MAQIPLRRRTRTRRRSIRRTTKINAIETHVIAMTGTRILATPGQEIEIDGTKIRRNGIGTIEILVIAKAIEIGTGDGTIEIPMIAIGTRTGGGTIETPRIKTAGTVNRRITRNIRNIKSDVGSLGYNS